jgi:phosphoribosylglycinamide formyltransferase-1
MPVGFVPFRFVYLVSGTGSVFEEVLRAVDEGILPVVIAGVIADRDCPAAERSRRRGIPTSVVPAADFARREEFDAATARAIESLAPDAIAVNYNYVLPPQVTAAYRHRILNPHFTLLPLFPGFGPIRQSLASGMRLAGVTVHLVDDTIDHGPIVAQAVRPVGPDDTEASLGRALFSAGAPLFIQAMRFLAEGRIEVTGGRTTVRQADYSRLPFVPALEPDIETIATRLERELATAAGSPAANLTGPDRPRRG